MPWFALALGAASLVSALLPSPGMFVAMGLGIVGVAAGWSAFRQHRARGGRRLLGAAALAIAALGLALASARYALTLAAVDRLERMLGAGGQPARVAASARVSTRLSSIEQ
jgi:hypothetical protein